MKVRLLLNVVIARVCVITLLAVSLMACGGGISESQAQPKTISPTQTASEMRQSSVFIQMTTKWANPNLGK